MEDVEVVLVLLMVAVVVLSAAVFWAWTVAV